MEWCANALAAIGITCPIAYQQVMEVNPELPIHRVAYLYLREAISHKIQSGALPILSLSSKPHAAFNWVPPDAENLELEADLEMELLDPQYIGVEALIASGGCTEV